MFQKENFSNILKKILINYDSIQDFANHVEMDRGYLSRNINMKLENPPTPKILKKIADNSKGVTTYEELMQVCGYLINENKSDLKKIKEAENTLKFENIIKKLELTIKEREILDKLIASFNDSCYIKKKSIENSEKKALSILDSYKNNEVNLKKIKEGFKLYIVSEASARIINIIYERNTAIDTFYNYNNLIKKSNELYRELITYDFINIKNNNSEPLTIKIPVVGTVAAGEPILAQQNIIDYEELPANEYSDGEYFGLKIKGNSMFPRILEDDVVIVKKQTTAETGQIAVVLINGDEATVKQIKKTESGIMLIPFNTTEYSPMFFTKEDIEKKPVKIIGIVKRLIGYNFG